MTDGLLVIVAACAHSVRDFSELQTGDGLVKAALLEEPTAFAISVSFRREDSSPTFGELVAPQRSRFHKASDGIRGNPCDSWTGSYSVRDFGKLQTVRSKLMLNFVEVPSDILPFIIILLAKNGYPPITHDEVYRDIFEQAENFKKYRG